jgi:anti-anti-sigma factor
MWKRYLLDFLKFSVLIWPAIFCRWFQSLKSRFTGNSTEPIESPCHASDTEDEVIFSLPKHLNATAAADSARHLQSASRITFDFSQVRTIDIDGLGTLARVWQRVEARGGAINIKGSSSAHKTYLACNMMTDFFGDTLNPSFSYRTESLPGEIVLVKLCGVLDTRQVGGINYRQLLEHIGQRDCIFDMTELAYIGSSGLMLMLNISKYILSSGNCFVICSPRHHVKQMFHITDLQRLFVILPNVSGAASFIHDVRGEAAP